MVHINTDHRETHMKKLISIFAFFFAFACADAQLYSITDSCSVLVIKNQTAGRSLTYPKNQLYADTTPGVLNLRTLGGTIVASWSSSQVSSLPASSIRNGYATVNYFLSYTCVHSTGQINPSATSPDTLYITDGRYLPDTSNTSNVSGANFFFAYWSQIDSIVYVDGEVNVRAKNTGVTTFNLSLPIPVSTYPFLSLSGLFNLYNSTNGGAIIEGVSNTAQFTYTATDTDLDVISFHFRYVNQNPLPGKIVNAVANYWTKKGLSLYPTDTNANVAIGTTTELAKLHIAGSLYSEAKNPKAPSYLFNGGAGLGIDSSLIGLSYGEQLNGGGIVFGNLTKLGSLDSSGALLFTNEFSIFSPNITVKYSQLNGFVLSTYGGQGGGITATPIESAFTFGTETGGSGVRCISDGADTTVEIRANGIITQLPTTQPQIGQTIVVSDTGLINKTVWGNAGWSLTGNAGTDPATNFLGTTDGAGFNIRTNNVQMLHFDEGTTYPNIVIGASTAPSAGQNDILIGNNVSIFNYDVPNYAIAIGSGASIGSRQGIAIGAGSQTSGFGNVGNMAIGYRAVSIYDGSTAIGYNAYNTTLNQFSIGSAQTTIFAPGMANTVGSVLTDDGTGIFTSQPPVSAGATGSEPSTPYLGQFYFDTTLTKMKFWNGTTWAIITSVP